MMRELAFLEERGGGATRVPFCSQICCFSSITWAAEEADKREMSSEERNLQILNVLPAMLVDRVRKRASELTLCAENLFAYQILSRTHTRSEMMPPTRNSCIPISSPPPPLGDNDSPDMIRRRKLRL